MGTPNSPFEVNYKPAKPGEKQLPPQWSIPFDEEFREVEEPNAPVASHSAYASIGWHVTKNALKYLPAYRVLGTFNLRINRDPAAVKAWEDKVGNGLTITDRRNGMITHILSSVSDFEAVTSWFVREHSHDNSVLCLDRKEIAPHGGGVWYIEDKRGELRVTLDAEGNEVPVDEPHVAEHYLLAQHPNAIMMYGE